MKNSSHTGPKRSDPLVDEVRSIRNDISQRWGNDVNRLVRHLQQAQRNHVGKIVSRKNRRARKTG
jgi:hypothetical protein